MARQFLSGMLSQTVAKHQGGKRWTLALLLVALCTPARAQSHLTPTPILDGAREKVMWSDADVLPGSPVATNPECGDPANCGDAFGPLCGSDGVTYHNDCQYAIAQCNNPELAVMFEEECQIARGLFDDDDSGSDDDDDSQDLLFLLLLASLLPCLLRCCCRQQCCCGCGGGGGCGGCCCCPCYCC